MPERRTREGVELARVGTYQLSTGPVTFRPEHLASAVKQYAQETTLPRLKIGHTDPRFDGDPSLGLVKNLRLNAAGDALEGDFDGMPAWLDEALGRDYPGLSIEAAMRGDDMRLTAVALLGQTRPGIDSLKDLEVALAAAAGEDAENVIYVAAALGAMPDPTTSPLVGADPAEASAQPDTDPKEHTVELSNSTLELLGLGEDATTEDVHARIAEMKDRPTPETHDAAVAAAAEAAKEAKEAKVEVPEGMKLVPEQEFADVKAAAASYEADKEQREQDKDTLILASGVTKGKYGPATRDKLAERMKADREGTRALIEVLPDNTVTIAASGADVPDEVAASSEDAAFDAYRESRGWTVKTDEGVAA